MFEEFVISIFTEIAQVLNNSTYLLQAVPLVVFVVGLIKLVPQLKTVSGQVITLAVQIAVFVVYLLIKSQAGEAFADGLLEGLTKIIETVGPMLAPFVLQLVGTDFVYNRHVRNKVYLFGNDRTSKPVG